MKKIIAALLTIIVCVTLVGCNNSKSDDKEAINNETSMEAEQSETSKRQKRETTQTTKETMTTKVEKNRSEIDELNDIVAKDVEDTINGLNAEYEQLKLEIDTYNKYLSNTDKMEEFYDKIYTVHKALCIRMYEYSLNYVNIIINSDMSNYDMYNELDELYENVYNDAGDDIYDGIYNGLLDDMYDDYYNGILDIDYDDIDNYSEWSDTLSNEYKLWSRTSSDVYDDWSDSLSDIYRFWSDVGSEIYKKDFEGVAKKIEKFQKNINKFKGIETSDKDAANEDTVTEKEETKSASEPLTGIRPEFKEALDSYEEFFDEYCNIMKKYMENPLDMNILTEYSEYLEKAEEMDKKLEALDDGEMSDEELKYYLEVTTRVTTKMLEIYQ